jgi:amino acid transporter|tara:strand:+ start:1810 stop:2163 length:354 start_codon:yes stop_codon:yes gene_type:complete
MNEKGNLSIFFFFILVAGFLLVLFAVFIPALNSITTVTYLAMEPTLDDANALAQGITDVGVRNAMTSALTSEKDAITTNTTILSQITAYHWLIYLLALLLVAFIFVRQSTQVTSRVA